MLSDMHSELIGQTEFIFKLAETPEEKNEIFQLRYASYCQELKFIKEEDCPGGLEKDIFDDYSLHFLCRAHNKVIATLRLVLDSLHDLPLEKYCVDTLDIEINELDHTKLGEASRLVISKDYRRRGDDGLYYTPATEYNRKPGEIDILMVKRIRPVAFGLYRELYQECRRRNITHLYAIMDDALYKLLGIHSFVFHQIGEEFDYYGPVKPYFANLREVELKIQEKIPRLMRYFLDGLETQYHPQLLTNE